MRERKYKILQLHNYRGMHDFFTLNIFVWNYIGMTLTLFGKGFTFQVRIYKPMKKGKKK
jgi:hypothetical protein